MVIVLGVLMLAIAFLYAVCSNEIEDNLIRALTGLLVILCLICGVLVGIYNNSDQPTAMDVYRGKTELSITYKVVGQDTVARDTIVVLKKKM